MIEIPNVTQNVIRNHYDVSTFFYWLFWGPHIHHGLWYADETPQKAQVQLTEALAKAADIKPNSTVLDIGCGMGGSSRWLASQLQCEVTGVTISPVQAQWARVVSRLQGIKPRPKFLCADAEKVVREPNSLDVLWSIECTEHLFEKKAFFERATSWLKPGGTIAICAWLAGSEMTDSAKVAQVESVCRGMFCPSLGTQKDYEEWLTSKDMILVESRIWTRQVERTWEICKDRVERSRIRWLAKLLGQDHVMFLDHFEAILEAYRSGAMEYGCFVARKKTE